MALVCASATLGQDPILVASVVRWININALHFSGIVWKQCLERKKVVTLDKQIPGIRITYRKSVVAPEQPTGTAPPGDDSKPPSFLSSEKWGLA